MNNKITVKNTSAIVVNKVFPPPVVFKPTENCQGLNDEIINHSYFNNYNGLNQAKVTIKEEYNPFKHQMGKD
jgi:hypothetical protein